MKEKITPSVVSPENHESVQPTAELYVPGNWQHVSDELLALEQEAFGSKAFTEKELQACFESEAALSVFLKSQDDIIVGFTNCEIRGTRAHINNTIVAKAFQGQGHVGILMGKLENNLRQLGVETVSRSVAVENGYAEKVQNHYGDNIVKVGPDKNSPWGVQRDFLIRL